MTDPVEWLDDWARSVPDLRQVDRGFWRSTKIGEVSFPGDAHATLASIEQESRWFAHRNTIFESAIARFPSSGPIFDVGGGNGFVSLGLKARGIPAIVVEPGAQGAATSINRGLPTVQAAYESLRIPDGSLPSVGMFDVLEHIESDVEALKSIHEALQSGGRLYVAVPAHQWLWSPIDELSGHFRRYSLPQLEVVMQNAGFAVEYSTYYFSALLPAILIGRVLSSRWVQASKSHPLELCSLASGASTRRRHLCAGACAAAWSGDNAGKGWAEISVWRELPGRGQKSLARLRLRPASMERGLASLASGPRDAITTHPI